jgi:microcystin degradation protein MlrC
LPKIAIAGFHHETNTFSPHLTTLADFELADNWPGITTGDDFFEVFKDGNMPMAGFIKQARKYNFDLYPLTWANAQPAGKVTKHAFESIVNKILDGLSFVISDINERSCCESTSKKYDKKDKLDAIYLDLHGSMVCEHIEDGEGELVYQIRKLLASFEIDIPIVISHDLHANISDTTFDLSDYIISYRTYPHIDMAKTGMAAAKALDMMLQLGGRLPRQPSASSQRQLDEEQQLHLDEEQQLHLKKHCLDEDYTTAVVARKPKADVAISFPVSKKIKRLNFLIPLTSQCTLTNPCKDIYQKLEQLEDQYNVSLSFNPAFPLADSTYTGPTVIGYDLNTNNNDNNSANNTDNLTTAITSLFEYINSKKHEFELKLFSEQEAINYYLKNNKPIIFADTQDNSGCGGVSNTTGILKVLAKNKIKNAAIAVMWDPKAAKIAHQNKIGDKITLSIGDGNFTGDFIIKNLTNGNFTGTGDFYKNMKIKLGLMALLEYNGIFILVSSAKMQAADQAVFTHLGIKAQDFSLLVLKSSVHFRADFSDLASDIILVESQGENIADLNKLEYELCDLV